MTHNRLRSHPRPVAACSDIARALSRRLVGQPAAIDAIVPYVQMYRAMLCAEGRPAGVFLLLGPTGTGKTKTVEALAEVLHGNSKKLLRIDCGEYQMEHEVAKLLGAPPGYLGHRETQPLLNQQKLNGAGSEGCDLSIVLFDEIEKAASSMIRLLLGVLDKATLRLGDNTAVNFEKTMIFLTSNLGARAMNRELQPVFGLGALAPRDPKGRCSKLARIGMHAVRKRFSPEFVNRIDAVVTYQPLGREALAEILDQQMEELREHIHQRLGGRSFTLDVTPPARRFLRLKGTSEEYGARELKRTIQRELVQPLAALVADGEIRAGVRVLVEVSRRGDHLTIRPDDDQVLAEAC